MLNKKTISIFSFVSVFSLFFASVAKAICPVCTIGVIAGLGLARWLRIDDTITGLWIGAFTVLLIMWTIQYLNNKKINFPGRDIILIILYYAFTLWPLRSFEIIGNEQHTIWGMDKLIFTIILGSVFFFGFEKWYRAMRAKRGKSLFRYQKVIWPILPLIILSIFFYFVTRYSLLCCYSSSI